MSQNYLLILIAAAVVGVILIVTKRFAVAGRVVLTLCAAWATFVATVFAAFLFNFSRASGTAMAVLCCILGGAVFLAITALLWRVLKRKAVWIPLLCITLATVLCMGGIQIRNAYRDSLLTVGSGGNLLAQYAPQGEGSKVAVLDEPPTLTLSEDLPRMDGATALYPIYAAFARAVYPEDALRDDAATVTCTTTTDAYRAIVEGEADIIFVAAPSEAQAAYAAEQGVELVFTPIGKEAFVFFVNANNPLDSISIAQIQGIYSGAITSWRELGVPMGRIRAFQRDEGSGSQSALQRLMGEIPLVKPKEIDRVQGMAGIIERAADYRNYKNAIGYSFRFYATEMVKNEEIKLLAIDGIAPTTETIENGTYPIASDFYAVTRADATAQTTALLDWIVGPQGQHLVQQTGYTPLH